MKAAYPELLPPLTPEEYAGLKADISEHGLQIPIEIDADKPDEILDGWHRYQICEELNLPISPAFKRLKHFATEHERIWFCLSLNLHRRHLNEIQRAAYITKYVRAPVAAAAKERQLQTLTQNGRASVVPKSEQRVTQSHRSHKELAERYKTTPSALTRTRAVQIHAPDYLDEVIAGRISPETALDKAGAPLAHANKARQKGKRRSSPVLDEHTFCTQLLADLKRKRKEHHVQLTGRRWNVQSS